MLATSTTEGPLDQIREKVSNLGLSLQLAVYLQEMCDTVIVHRRTQDAAAERGEVLVSNRARRLKRRAEQRVCEGVETMYKFQSMVKITD